MTFRDNIDSKLEFFFEILINKKLMYSNNL